MNYRPNETDPVTAVSDSAVWYDTFGVAEAGRIPGLSGTVVDENSGRPVEDATVILQGYEPTRTDYRGAYVTEGFSGGEARISVYKLGYLPSRIVVYNTEGEPLVFDITLEKPSQHLTIQGRVVKIIVAEGTRSKITFFMIRGDDGAERYLFDETGSSGGFDSWQDTEVEITGFIDTGFVGWERREEQGIFVTDIHRIKQD